MHNIIFFGDTIILLKFGMYTKILTMVIMGNGIMGNMHFFYFLLLYSSNLFNKQEYLQVSYT